MNLLREKLRACGHHRLQCSDGPDLGPMYAMAEKSAKLGEESLAWYKQMYEDQKPLIAKAAERADAVADAQLETMNNSLRLANEYDEYRKNTFQPVEQRLVDDAMKFNTDEERERLAGEAGADTAQAFGAARSQMVRDAGRHGVNPADGGFVAAMGGMAGQEALQSSFLKNKTRQDAKTIGRAMLMDSASLGRNLASQQATSASLAVGAGTAAANTGTMPVTLNSNNAQLGAQGYGMAMQGYGQAGNLYGQGASLEQKAAESNAAMWQGAGSAAMMFMSDETKKEDIEPVDPEKALEAVESTPVSNWAYKAGMGDEATHTGPMAQDVNRTMGEAAAPKGKMIDPITVTGVTLAAVKGLSKKVDELAAAMGMGEEAPASRRGGVAAASGLAMA